MKQQAKNQQYKPIPKVPPSISRKLTTKEQRLKKMMMSTAKKFAKDPEKVICSKIGIGSCWEF